MEENPLIFLPKSYLPTIKASILVIRSKERKKPYQFGVIRGDSIVNCPKPEIDCKSQKHCHH